MNLESLKSNLGLSRFSRRQLILGSAALVILLAVVVGVVTGSGRNGFEKIRVERRDLVDEVKVAGRVEADSVAGLGFEVTGSVSDVFVSVGDIVEDGQILASLSLGTLLAELSQAQADVSIKEAEFITAQTNLTQIIELQNTLVDNAYRKLLSSGLSAAPSLDSVTASSPKLTGRYIGPEGRYKVHISNQPGNNKKYSIRTFGIETTGLINILETSPTPLGSFGLFISFPESIDEYENTTWYIVIPNTESSSYTDNLNTYENALRTRDVEIQKARASLDIDTLSRSVVQAELDRARADVDRVQADIARRRLLAPFSGIVGRMDIERGDIVSANTVIASVISKGDFGVGVDLPEIESVKVNVGDVAKVTLDAFGDDVMFDATVLYVNVAETLLDNVAVYEARVEFNEQDERIASGMTADVTIATDSRENVIAVPLRAIKTDDDGNKYVLRETATGNERVIVMTGLRGSDSFVEILSGLKENDIVLISK